jgi:N-methyl-L-proline demethylase
VRANPAGAFQLFRIGDAVEARNTHAAIYDALRLVKDL